MGMPKPKIKTFIIGEVCKVKDLIAPDDIWNGTQVIVMSKPYQHPKTGMTVMNVMVDECTGWAVEPWNLEKIGEEEYDAYVDKKYLDPNGTGDPYDGNKVVKWSDCVWKPKNLKKQDDFQI